MSGYDDDSAIWGPGQAVAAPPLLTGHVLHVQDWTPPIAPVQNPGAATALGAGPGVKHDDGKPDTSLLQDFGDALLEVALVGTYGKIKYSRGGWRTVPEGIVRYTAAMLRHFFAERKRKYDAGDPFYETAAGLPYKGRIREAAQTAWNALARLQLMLEEEQNGSK